MPKWAVPQLLQRLETAMADKWSRLAKAGFRACGIYPLNPQKVLQRHFSTAANAPDVSQSLIAFLEDRREASTAETQVRARRRRLQVPPDQVVSVADLELMEAAAAAPRGRGRGRTRG